MTRKRSVQGKRRCARLPRGSHLLTVSSCRVAVLCCRCRPWTLCCFRRLFVHIQRLQLVILHRRHTVGLLLAHRRRLRLVPIQVLGRP